MRDRQAPDFKAFLDQAHYYQALAEEYAAQATVAEVGEAMIRLSYIWQDFIRNITRDAELLGESRRLLAEADNLLKGIKRSRD